MNKNELFELLKEKDTTTLQTEMKLIFEEKLEKKMWKVYASIEPELKETIERYKKKNKKLV